jgi:hypothetical protein
MFRGRMNVTLRRTERYMSKLHVEIATANHDAGGGNAGTLEIELERDVEGRLKGLTLYVTPWVSTAALVTALSGYRSVTIVAPQPPASGGASP